MKTSMVTSVFGTLAVAMLLGGCQSSHQRNQSSQQFIPFPSNPSSITVTKYPDSNPKNQSSYTLTGKKMEALYGAIQDEAKRPMKAGESYNCPSYSSGTTIWDYRIVVHYQNHANRTFTQTDATGCTELKDEQTGAVAMGYLPGLSPFG